MCCLLTIPTSLKVSNLWSFGCTTIDTSAFDTGRLAIVISNLLDLLSQLSGRGKHQTLWRDEEEGWGRFSDRLQAHTGDLDQTHIKDNNTYRIYTHNRTIPSLQIGLVVDVYNSRKKVLQGANAHNTTKTHLTVMPQEMFCLLNTHDLDSLKLS